MTNLGLIFGLGSSPNPKRAIVGSIMIIAVADNISDSLGIHIFQESERVDEKEVWFSTFTNYSTRLLLSLSFVALVALLPIGTATACAIVWALLLLTALSWAIAQVRGESALSTTLEHVVLAACVCAASRFVGKFFTSAF
jgi:VIT1/CCC1 family predicted Fe2+/Mn2+ transporter